VSDAFRVTLQTLQEGPTAVGAAGTHTLIVDRPVEGGGRGLGFNGGQLLYLAIGGCISNDLYREAAAQGIALTNVTVEVDGDFPGVGAPSTPVSVTVDVAGDASVERLRTLVDHVAEIAEIPLSMRDTTPVSVSVRRVESRPTP
jgi:putative redox protein